MGFIKRLLGLEKKEEVIEQVIEPIVEVKQPSTEVRSTCKICSQVIYMDDKYTKQVGDYYHRKCWKEVKKQAWGS